MTICPEIDYVNRTYYQHHHNVESDDDRPGDDKRVCLSTANISVNKRNVRIRFPRHAGCTIDLSGQDISLLMPIPKLQASSTLFSSTLFITPSLSTLTHLKLACNELESIPENIGLLENLMHLDISHNRIQSLPSSVGSLSNLTVLQARDNLLEELPQEIGRLSALSVLDISQNNITVLPAEMLRLANLCHLVTTRCPLITKLPKPAPHNPLSLRESCARSIVRHRIPLDRKLPIHLRNYVVSAKECSMCSKPCYEGTVCRYTLHDRAGQVIPVQYTLCNPHWDDRKELLLAMFSTTNSPALYHYIAENDITYQESNALWMAVEPVSTNHRASLVSPLTVQSSQRKRTIWRRTTDSLLNRQASA